MTQVYPKPKNPYAPVFSAYISEYETMFGVSPEIVYGICGGLIRQRLKNHSIKGLIKIIELYFEEEGGENTIFDLKVILSAYFINKYAPKLRLNPNMYANAEKWNKEVY